MTYIPQIVDPQVGPFSPIVDIRAWLEKLKSEDVTSEIQLAIDEAEQWLEKAEKRCSPRLWG